MEYSFNQLLQEIANGKRQITIKAEIARVMKYL